MKKNRITLTSLITVSMMLLSLLGSGTTIAGEPNMEQGPIATVTIEAGVISWEAQVENGGLILTIAGPGEFYLQQEYQSGAHPTFKPDDGMGNPLPDGSYRYELQLVPAKVEAPAEYDETQRGIMPTEGAEKALVQSGYFSILSGGFVIPDVAESAADWHGVELLSPDIVHNDDVIIQGSLCVGNDCADGEDFGFDTIRLKENNLRIKFQDTSIGSFPTNDWQIIINDSTNGGASYFGIEDVDGGTRPFTIEAGAPNYALYVDDNGNLTIAGLLTEASDQALKDNFRPVDGQQVLEGIAQLPISTWNFISDGQAIQHMGPVAQDFYATFGLGADDRHIAPLDANGVALAGVQELHQMLLEREAQVAELQQQNADLEARLAQLEALVNTLVEAQSAPEGQ